MKTIMTMLLELNELGYSDAELGRKTRIPQPTITRLRNGEHADTSYKSGKSIESLYCELVDMSINEIK